LGLAASAGLASAAGFGASAAACASRIGCAGAGAAATAAALAAVAVASTIGASAARAITGAARSAITSIRLRKGFFIARISGWCRPRGSERRRAGLAGANADDLVEVVDEDLAVADLAGSSRLLDRLDRLID